MMPNMHPETQRHLHIEQLKLAIAHQEKTVDLNERRIDAMKLLLDARRTEFGDGLDAEMTLHAQIELDCSDIAIAEFNNDFAVKQLEAMRAQLDALENPSHIVAARITPLQN